MRHDFSIRNHKIVAATALLGIAIMTMMSLLLAGETASTNTIFPPTCVGKACNGLSVEQTNCVDDAKQLDEYRITSTAGVLEVLYSINCQAAFAVVTLDKPHDSIVATIETGRWKSGEYATFKGQSTDGIQAYSPLSEYHHRQPSWQAYGYVDIDRQGYSLSSRFR